MLAVQIIPGTDVPDYIRSLAEDVVRAPWPGEPIWEGPVGRDGRIRKGFRITRLKFPASNPELVRKTASWLENVRQGGRRVDCKICLEEKWIYEPSSNKCVGCTVVSGTNDQPLRPAGIQQSGATQAIFYANYAYLVTYQHPHNIKIELVRAVPETFQEWHEVVWDVFRGSPRVVSQEAIEKFHLRFPEKACKAVMTKWAGYDAGVKDQKWRPAFVDLGKSRSTRR